MAPTENDAESGESEAKKPGLQWREVLQRITEWVAIPSAIAGIVGFIAPVLIALVAPGDFNLVVWIREDEAVYPSRETGDLKLPLEYAGQPVESVTIARINVANLGSNPIGMQEERWKLHLTEPTASHVVSVSDLRVTPESTIAAIVEPPAANTVTLELGILPSKAAIDVELMVLNAERPGLVDLEVGTSLAGLPEPQRTRSPLRDRIGARLFGWMVLVFALVLIWEQVREIRSSPEFFKPLRAGIGRLAGRAFSILLASSMAGFVIAKILGFLLQFVI